MELALLSVDSCQYSLNQRGECCCQFGFLRICTIDERRQHTRSRSRYFRFCIIERIDKSGYASFSKSCQCRAERSHTACVQTDHPICHAYKPVCLGNHSGQQRRINTADAVVIITEMGTERCHITTKTGKCHIIGEPSAFFWKTFLKLNNGCSSIGCSGNDVRIHIFHIVGILCEALTKGNQTCAKGGNIIVSCKPAYQSTRIR